jgi:hypothetical protein
MRVSKLESQTQTASWMQVILRREDYVSLRQFADSV